MPSDLDEVFALTDADRKKINHLKQLWSPWKNPEAEEDKRIVKRPVIAQDDKQRAIRNLRLYSNPGEVMTVLTLAYNDPVIKMICLSPELDDHWRKIIQQILPLSCNQNNGEDIMPYKGIPVFESLELCGLLRLYYLNTRAKKGVHHKHTKALLEKIFACRRFHLIQLLTHIERHLLQSNKVTLEKEDITYYQEIAARITKLYGTYGCYEAAALLVDIGIIMVDGFQYNVSQKLYIGALKYIYLSDHLRDTYLLSKRTQRLIAENQALGDYKFNNANDMVDYYFGSVPSITFKDKDQAQKQAITEARILLQSQARQEASLSKPTFELANFSTKLSLA